MYPISLSPLHQHIPVLDPNKAREQRAKAQKLFEQQAYDYLKIDPYRGSKVKASDFKGQVLKDVYA